MRIPMQSLLSRIILSIVLTVFFALTPVIIFVYSYGEILTQSNLYNQLDVSMNDIKIRFSATIGDLTDCLDVFSSDETVKALAEGNIVERTQLDLSAAYSLAGREDDAVLTVLSSDGHVLYTTASDIPFYVDFSSRVPSVQDFCGIRFSTGFRYTSFEKGEIVINMIKCIRNDDGSVSAYALLDVVGTQFVRYADPALVNEVCLLNTETGMVSSLIHLNDYRPLDEGWVFSPYDFSEGFSRIGDVLVTHDELPEYGFILIGYLDISPYMDSMNSFYTMILVIIASAFIVSIIIAFFLGSSIVKPISRLIAVMGQVERKGDFDVEVPHSRIKEMEDLNDKFSEMLRQIKLLIQKNEEERDKVVDAERKALEAQMNPHFLFNTLNVIRSMARLNGEKDIEDITIKLGRLLRYAVDNRQSSETIENSFLMVESYLGIQRVRFGEKLNISISLSDDIKNVVTPKLIIQPLVENAITHGLEPKLGVWNLEITAVPDGCGNVEITVSDNGVGFDDALYQDMENLAHSTHTGMYNVYKRLRLCYGSKAVFRVKSEKGRGSRIYLKFPASMGDCSDV